MGRRDPSEAVVRHSEVQGPERGEDEERTDDKQGRYDERSGSGATEASGVEVV
jgi:hypothetical protein